MIELVRVNNVTPKIATNSSGKIQINRYWNYPTTINKNINLFIILKNLKMTIKNQYFVFKDINVDNPFYKK